jgi:hypothetical protein
MFYFSWIFFGASWIFLIVWLIGLLIAIFKGKSSNIDERESDSDSDEER